ncbi:protein of unknown function [Geodermatophilus dictyosporus]|uniref:DUF4386 domain-containing protein n=1 Tax=Geodermatophilus dictyosporus TaxID=1523247 RepID=A0A1I5L3N6_9ACTN|nr:DUF4386 domain-containing protein [Geodermatophilus dictyosporus]SFO91904.1 protein of unknown function [Geodermatophilus dictyosporus]
MSAPVHPPAAARPPTDPMRRTSLAAGILYLLTFVSMPTLALYQDARDEADFVLGAGSDAGVLVAAFSEVVVALAGIGTAVVLFPVAKRVSETAALGFVASRVVEGALIIVGVVSVLTLLTLRTDVAGTADADAASLVTTGHALSAVYDWTFLLSQSLAPVFNGLCLGYVLYRSGLVPRVLPALGLGGAPLLLASDIAILFGVYDRAAPLAVLAALPIAVWEFSLGVYLTVRGFRPSSPLLTRPHADGHVPPPRTGDRELEEPGAAVS